MRFLPIVLMALLGCSTESEETSDELSLEQAECSCSADFYFETVKGQSNIVMYQPIPVSAELTFIGEDCKNDNRFASMSDESKEVLRAAIGKGSDGFPKYGTYAIDLSVVESPNLAQGVEIIEVHQVLAIEFRQIAEEVRAAGQCEATQN